MFIFPFINNIKNIIIIKIEITIIVFPKIFVFIMDTIMLMMQVIMLFQLPKLLILLQ
jgi:hypothetical protein